MQTERIRENTGGEKRIIVQKKTPQTTFKNRVV